MNSDPEPARPGILRHLPNSLTLLRIGIAAVFPFSPEALHLLLILVGLATEFLDGFIARLGGWDSYLGQILDPIADKLLVLSISVTWILIGKISLLQWVLLATRDFGVLLIFLVLLATGRAGTTKSVAARFPSKLTTALQYLVFLLVLSGNVRLITPLAIVTATLGLAATLQYAFLINQSRR